MAAAPNGSSSIAPGTGLTRLQTSLQRARDGGAPSVGQWMEFPGYSLARTVAALGEDELSGCLIDCEHGNIDDAEMYHAVGAVATAGASPVVRVASSEPWQIKRALDSGAHGIMVPMCETKEQARLIAAATHYPARDFPQGIRGAGGLFAPANFGLSAPEYMRVANERVVVIVQIESRAAIENVDDIAAVEGIDALFVGPNDLASSMGHFAFDHASIPEVQLATARVLAAAKRAGKFAGHFALGAEAAALRVKQGWHFVNCGADIVAVVAWMSAEMAKLRALVAVEEEVADDGDEWDGKDWG